MDDVERKKYEASAKEIRTELKQFEGDWAKQNNGSKPSREDIKNNPDIAKKYKQYNHVRDILAGKVQPPKPKAKELPKTRKRSSDENLALTPSKRQRSLQTPSKPRNYDVFEEMSFETPLRRLFSPAMPTSIGPTPQKDGRVLGLFDLLVENNENTPSKPQTEDASKDDTQAQVQATPSKKFTATASDIDDAETVKLGRTPMSSSKRNMLNTFMTPLKARDGNTATAQTPTTVSRLQFSTPSFLRRAPLPPVDEDGSYKSPQRSLRLPRKPLGRSLSSVVAGLRKLEEEKLDDDLDALRDMEDENEAGPKPKPIAKKPAPKPQDEVLEPDSQGPQLLGGFDDEALYDSPTEEALDRDGRPLRVYKKKGQKRTTRRVNMRPTRSKRPEAEEKPDGDPEDEDAVPETQFDATNPDNNNDDDPLDLGGSDSDFEDEPEEEEGEAKKAGARKKQPAKKASKKDGEKKSKGTEKENGPVKKAARKVNEFAHTNFKRLKLKNHGAKGGPGFGSRFRRRR